ncbi:MAG: Na(+)-translocating NADH-quinone reductase subunit A [Alphaproteobacteria bacterium]
MPMRIIQGLDIPIDGVPEQTISDRPEVSSVALLGSDYLGLSPSLRVQEGDRVKLGQPLFLDRKHPDIVFTAPGSGVVTEINRGRRRALQSVVLRLEGDEQETFSSWPGGELAALRRDQVKETLLASGLWTALRERPYSKVPDPKTTPRSIFVTALDSNPLAARSEVVIEEYPSDFATGLTLLSRLTDGPVFLCKAPYVDLPQGDSERISTVEFSGPHPSGLPGTHIHLLDPVGARGSVWYLGYQDVIAMGKLFTSGRLWVERIVALGGPVVKRPRLIRARLGASLDDLTQGELLEGAARIISGSVLSGRRARRTENHLGRHHSQVSVIAEARTGGERNPKNGGAFSTHSILVPSQPRKRRFALTSALHGRQTAMVPLGGFERVMPLDILPTQLLRALLVGDTDMARALGCLELDEEDLALCSFVCPSKLNYGPLLRAALGRIEKDG